MIDKEKVKNMMAFDLLFEISWYDQEKRMQYYSNKEVSDKIQEYFSEASKDYWHYFRKLVEMIDVDEIFIAFKTSTIINFMTNNAAYGYIFFGALIEYNKHKTLNILLNNDELFKYLVKYMYYLASLMSGLTVTEVKNILKKINQVHLQDENYAYEIISTLSSEEQNELISDIEDIDTLVKIIRTANIDVKKNFFLNDKRATYMYKYFDVVKLSQGGIKFNNDILNDSGFFEKIKVLDINMMRSKINIIESVNPSDQLRQKLFKYYDDIIAGYDKELDILDVVKPYFETFGQQAKELSSRMLRQVVIDRLFEDNMNNVHLNIKEILRYNNLIDEKVLDQEKIKFYNLILNIESLSNDEKIDIYNKYKNKNVQTSFYIELRALKDISYNEINSALFKPDKAENSLVTSVRDNFGTHVYDLVNSKYTMLVRCIRNPFSKMTRHERDCYSLISNENTAVYDEESYIYGYDYIDISRILHINENDSFSTDNYNKNNITTHMVNRIMSSEEIINKSSEFTNYSEIQIENKKLDTCYEALSPSYIISYDKITKDVLDESRRLNIPICIIKKKELDLKNDSYIEGGKYKY